MTETANKVRFGLSNIHIAVMTADATWATPVKVPGAVNMTANKQSSQNDFYADNGIYYVGNSDQGWEGELEIALIPDSVKASLGLLAVDADGAYYGDPSLQPKQFALLGQIEGDQRGRRVVYYGCTPSMPSLAAPTKGENGDPQTETLSFKAIAVPVDATHKSDFLVVEDTTATATVYTGFFNSVHTPNYPS